MTEPDDELDKLVHDYHTLTPEQRDRLVQRAIERAKAERAAAIRNLFRRLWDWIARRAAIAELQRYDDRMLRDIGLHRSEIEAAVTGTHRAGVEGLATPAAMSRCPSKATQAPAGVVHECAGKAA